MHRHGSRFGLLALVLLSGLAAAVLAPLAAAAESGRPVEHSGLACESCHLDGERATPETARRLVATQVRLCGRCHEPAVTYGHPAGFTPARHLPRSYPLDWKGQMTCSTCHEMHGDEPDLLRRGAGRGDLCAACHAQVQFASTGGGGALPLLGGHLERAEPPGGAEIDGFSARCVQCHVEEFSLPGHERVAFTAWNGTGMANHPIGSPYTHGDSGRDLRAPALLPAGIDLPEGRVSCVSCHQGYALDHGAPVQVSGNLCTTCHEK